MAVELGRPEEKDRGICEGTWVQFAVLSQRSVRNLREGITTMKMLASKIERELQDYIWQHCAVYEADLRRLWPINETDRETKIEKFAKKYGFRLKSYREGVCAIFDKAPPRSN